MSSNHFDGPNTSSLGSGHNSSSGSGRHQHDITQHRQLQPQHQIVDRLKLLYPNVDENVTPLPRCWSKDEKCNAIGLSQNNLRVHYKAGTAKQHNDPASVRTAHPIPVACGIYYFEVKILTRGRNGYMGIGLTAQQFRLNRLPGWDKQSYGYHGDDGNSFSSSGSGQTYGPTFTAGDIIGCCVNFVSNTCFYTKNGVHLGIAFRDLPTRLYPTVGLQTPGEEVDANFGQEPFKFGEIENIMQEMRDEIKASILNFPLSGGQAPTKLMHNIVSSYLVHNGYSETAEAFARSTNQTLKEDISSIRKRQDIMKLVLDGKVGQAIELTRETYPGLLENNQNLWFMLKCRQFIEMINGSDAAAEDERSSSSQSCASTSSTSNSNTGGTTQNGSSVNSNTTNNPATLAKAAAAAASVTSLKTSVIQSTKSYHHNGGGAQSVHTANNSIAVINSNNGRFDGNVDDGDDDESPEIKQEQNHGSLVTLAEAAIEYKTTASSTTLTSTNRRSNNNNNNGFVYTNDIEMENNGDDDDDNGDVDVGQVACGQHSLNGNSYKNGNFHDSNATAAATAAVNTQNSAMLDEQMDVDMPTTSSNAKQLSDFGRILQFGRELSRMGQKLEDDNKLTDQDRQMLEDAFSLMAYSNPWLSTPGWQLSPTQREVACFALNSEILNHLNFVHPTPLVALLDHAQELLRQMAQESLGSCAFVNLNDIFPTN